MVITIHDDFNPVSYTHLTLPTNSEVSASVGVVTLKKKQQQQQ